MTAIPCQRVALHPTRILRWHRPTPPSCRPSSDLPIQRRRRRRDRRKQIPRVDPASEGSGRCSSTRCDSLDRVCCVGRMAWRHLRTVPIDQQTALWQTEGADIPNKGSDIPNKGTDIPNKGTRRPLTSGRRSGRPKVLDAMPTGTGSTANADARRGRHK